MIALSKIIFNLFFFVNCHPSNTIHIITLYFMLYPQNRRWWRPQFHEMLQKLHYCNVTCHWMAGWGGDVLQVWSWLSDTVSNLPNSGTQRPAVNGEWSKHSASATLHWLCHCPRIDESGFHLTFVPSKIPYPMVSPALIVKVLVIFPAVWNMWPVPTLPTVRTKTAD